MTGSRQLVLVSGAPGAGKTSLAVPLAAELGFALIAKDRIKEALHDALGAPDPDLSWSRRLSAAAMELMWTLAADAPSVVLEANFRPRSAYQRERLSALSPCPVEVHCRCDPALAARRYGARAAGRHPVHVLASLTPDMRAEYDGPIGLGPVVAVDTSSPVDATRIATAVRAFLPAALAE